MKKQKNKVVALHSAFFPFYGFITGNYKDFLWMIAANLLLLTVVAFFAARILKTEDRKDTMDKIIARGFLAGVITDFVAMFFRFLPHMTEMLLRLVGLKGAADFMGRHLSDFTIWGDWGFWNLFGMPWGVGSVVLAGVVAFWLNYRVMFKNVIPDRKQRIILAIVLAICNAPWSWFNHAW